MKHRLQFDFSDESLKELDDLKDTTGLSRAELIRQALRFLQWTFDQHKSGASVLLQKNGQVREIVFPFWTVTSPQRSTNSE
jgi:Ribbon-helix-helix protein, copG family